MDTINDPPIACTLTGGTYHQRLAWIADLARDGLRSHQRNDLVLDLRYARAVADRVRDMVAKERACCAFLQFDVAEIGEDVQLTITAPERARDVAEALFAQFISLAQAETERTEATDPCCGADGTIRR